MFVDVIKPAIPGPVICAVPYTKVELPARIAFKTLPVNLTADEIREMVREVLG